MNWKLFLTACISLFCIAIPGNIFSCGPEEDPYDYYTSFFSNNLSDARGFKPFYYTGYTFLYDDNEPEDLSKLLAIEWADYCSNNVTAKDAYKFVNKFNRKDVNNLYLNIEKHEPLAIPDSVKQNTMTNYFLKSKDLEGLGYILFAKQVEPNVGGTSVDWEPVKRDSVKLYRLAKNGIQLYNAAKQNLFKLKYAYQVLRLYHYGKHYPEVISFYDENIKTNSTQSVLQPLCSSLKAGALLHTGRKADAAYLFSRVFDETLAKRISNYISFNWCIDSNLNKKQLLTLCKNDHEKAVMQGMFSLGNPENQLQVLKDIYSLDPLSPMLEILSIREINKLEEKYLSPSLEKEKGGKRFFINWDTGVDSIYREASKELSDLAIFLHKVAGSRNQSNPGLFETGAAYTAFMMRDYRQAGEYLSAAEKMNLSPKIRDQWTLTKLLVTINSTDKIDASFEEKVLPSMQWLESKAKQDDEWKKFYRNLMSEIIAKKYDRQGDIYKETLAIGTADNISGNGFYGIDFLQNNLSIPDVQKLYVLLNSTSPSNFEKYLINHNTVKKNNVIDFMGTAYLREQDFSNAINWLQKSTDKKILQKNPFIELLKDREEMYPSEKILKTTKLGFAQEMLRLQNMSVSDKINASKYLYKMALGFYNITYYGHTWELVQYYRSGADGYHIPKDATPFLKDYYGCFTAEKYFEKAMNVSSDKNFKAHCLFMMAKCAQKQIHQPQYEEYESNYDQYDAAMKLYTRKFIDNKYFPRFIKEYSSIPFYNQAFSSCSYLRDFIKRNK